MHARPIRLMHDSMRTALSARRVQSLHACAAIWYNVHRKPSSSQEMAFAGVAQLVEYLPSKQAVAGSSPVSRSKLKFIRVWFTVPQKCLACLLC